MAEGITGGQRRVIQRLDVILEARDLLLCLRQCYSELFVRLLESVALALRGLQLLMQ